MLRSIYRVASTGSSKSRDSFASLFHRGVLQVVRCGDDEESSNTLEVFEVERRESSIVITSRMLTLDCGGGDVRSKLFAVHCMVQRPNQVHHAQHALLNHLLHQPQPIIGALAALSDGRFAVRVFGACSRDASLEEIASDCHEVLLDFVPTLLKDTLLPSSDESPFLRAAFLVSGSCKSVRIVAQRASSGLFELLPEASLLVSFPAVRAQVLCVDSRQLAGSSEFVTAFGCDDGSLVLSMPGAREHRLQLDGPLSAVVLFSRRSSPRAVGRSPRQHLWADRPLLVWPGSVAPAPPGAIDWAGLTAPTGSSIHHCLFFLVNVIFYFQVLLLLLLADYVLPLLQHKLNQDRSV
jgi:hypothetical protein